MKDDEYKTSDQDDIEDHIEEEHPDERVLTSFNIQVDFR